MSDTLSQPSCTAYFTKYNPQLKPILGSQNAVILFDRLEYWFSKKQSQFYKFIEPCDHPLCKQGDTWADELGFSKKVFRTAFDKIGVRYKSKTEFENEHDPFKGKFFAYYQDRQTKKTIFVRNNALVSDLYQKLKSFFSQKADRKVRKQTLDEKRVGGSSSPIQKKGSPTADPLGSPHVSATKDKQITTSFKHKIILKKEKENKDNQAKDNNNQDKALAMITIWKNTIGETQKLTSLTSARLIKALETVFDNNLDLFEAHCLKIGSSKFLMGEKEGYGSKPYQLNLFVAISQTFKTQLDEGYFEINTRDNLTLKKATRDKDQQALLQTIRTTQASEPIKSLWSHMAAQNWALFKSWIYPNQFRVSDHKIVMIAKSSFIFDRLTDCEPHILETLRTFSKNKLGLTFEFQKG